MKFTDLKTSSIASSLAFTLLLTACGGGGQSPGAQGSTPDPVAGEPTDPVDPGEPNSGPRDRFVLEEATVQSVHAAFRGETVLDDNDTVLTCETLVEMYQQRVIAYNNNPQPNGGLPIRGVLALSTTALDQAKDLDVLYDRDGGIGDRPLHCMPVLLKDNYDTFDQPSTQGSYSMLGHRAGVDAASVAGLREHGALILGKANQDEFAFFTTGFSARAIQVSNPYNTQESPAGSSSGTGASLGANFALGGTGSDTCQSIRHPSSVNGLVGIRPSIGVISAHGIYPLNHARDTGGPMTRSVTDSALMLSAMASVDSRDPRTEDFPSSSRPASYTEFLDRDAHGLAGKNIGIVRDLGGNASAAGTGQQGTLIAAAADKMTELGATVYDFYLPDYASLSAGNTHYDMNEYWAQFDSEGGSAARCALSDALATETHGRTAACLPNTSRNGIVESNRTGPRTAAFIALSAASNPDAAPTPEQLQAIVDMRDYVTAEMDELKDEVGEPVLNGAGNPIRIDALIFSPGPAGGRTCDFGSTTQMGSIVVPVGFDSSVAGTADTEGRGVPRGMEIFVRRFDEGTGLGIAYDYEQATLHRAPPIISPAVGSDNETVQQFNAAQEALLIALTENPPEQCDASCATAAAAALAEITGP